MTDYFRFFFTYPRLLSFGLLLTLFSSFGQTFLLSLFVPHWMEAFRLDSAQFGFLYATATLLSAASLPFFGRLIDRTPLRRFSLSVVVGMVMACFLVAVSSGVIWIFLGVLALRLTGQGLLGLTASTAMGRFFQLERGKALSISEVGFPMGEANLPSVVVLLIFSVGWRWSWAIFGGIIALTFLPAVVGLFHGAEAAGIRSQQPETEAKKDLRLLRDWRFYWLLPGNLFLPFVLTALFLYQMPLANDRGWPPQIMAAAFIGFAGARVAGTLLVGNWIDRWSAVRLFPFILAPACLGLIFLSVGGSSWMAFAFFGLAGLSQGIANPMMTALWAEVFGVESLGATKGAVATACVFATALSPLLMGGLLKIGVPFAVIVPGCVVLGLLALGVSLLARRWLGPTLETRKKGEKTCAMISI